MVQQELQQVLVLEDDVRFEPRFCSRLVMIMENVQRVRLEWELMLVIVAVFSSLVYVAYSHFFIQSTTDLSLTFPSS